MHRNRKKKKKICCYFLIMAILCFCGCTGKESGQLKEIKTEDKEPENDSEKLRDSREENKNPLFVHICGAVNNPGVYEMSPGSRIYEGILEAGGMTDQAAADALNQAEALQDGQRVYVPTLEEVQQPAPGTPSAGTDSDLHEGKVNLNTASKEVLMTLSGIGEAKADSIIRYREEHGGFKSIEEVTQIEGIKDGVFLKIKDLITV